MTDYYSGIAYGILIFYFGQNSNGQIFLRFENFFFSVHRFETFCFYKKLKNYLINLSMLFGRVKSYQQKI